MRHIIATGLEEHRRAAEAIEQPGEPRRVARRVREPEPAVLARVEPQSDTLVACRDGVSHEDRGNEPLGSNSRA